ncbi:enoyl-CoA hydratase/isomerase family protein [Prauserella halophila]|uniref:Enoyl-CoA hydratase/isomerase family protein n=1 Tax=Prauserella halophila TaxID=185641 RepID=A0ABN1WJI5_9PSEU|nr:enoyl-CoA hydratase/isomerase family protein [Prauserella halophila]MCP2238177.1 enoyl-CoA hydratase [Prauserella halophila]
MSKILKESRGRVTILTIDRPEKMNALDYDTNQELIEAFDEFEADADAYVAVLTGAGDKAFCAGADMTDYPRRYLDGKSSADFRVEYTDGPGFGGITRNFSGTKPVVTAINGYCLSGGLELALAADIRFCTDTAIFGLQDVNWGFHSCDGGSIRLPHVVGHGNAMELILSGERIDAAHALRIGLVNRVFPQDELLERTLEFAERLATRAPLAQRFAKDVIRSAIGMNLDEALRMETRSFRDLADTEDLREGYASFAEKRPATFKGR